MPNTKSLYTPLITWLTGRPVTQQIANQCLISHHWWLHRDYFLYMLQYSTISPFLDLQCWFETLLYSIITDKPHFFWPQHCLMWPLPSIPNWVIQICRPQHTTIGGTVSAAFPKIPPWLHAGTLAARLCCCLLRWRAGTCGTLKPGHSYFPPVTSRINLPPHSLAERRGNAAEHQQ